MSLLLESFRPDQFLLSSLGVSKLEEVRTFRWRGLTQVRCRELLLRSRDPSDNGMRVCLPLLRISSVFRTFAGYLVRSLCRFPTLPRTARHGTARLGRISGSCVSRGPDAGTVDLDLPRRSLRVGPTTSSSSHRPRLHGIPGRALFHSWPPRLCPNPRWCFPSLLEHLDFTCELSSMDVWAGRKALADRWPWRARAWRRCRRKNVRIRRHATFWTVHLDPLLRYRRPLRHGRVRRRVERDVEEGEEEEEEAAATDVVDRRKEKCGRDGPRNRSIELNSTWPRCLGSTPSP